MVLVYDSYREALVDAKAQRGPGYLVVIFHTHDAGWQLSRDATGLAPSALLAKVDVRAVVLPSGSVVSTLAQAREA